IIAGQTGLGYVVEPDGIRITPNTFNAAANGTSQPAASADDTAQRTAAALRSDSYVGQITLPGAIGTTYSFYIRETDLPDHVIVLRKAKLLEAGERIRQALSATSRPHD